jgi:histidine ammonia-lyase
VSQYMLDGEHLTIEAVWAVAHASDAGELGLTPETEARVNRARAAVEQFVADGRIIYGITTGFGAFKDRVIPPDQVRELQRNIVMSHAVGVGAPFETPVVRAMMLIRANTLAKGHSGIRLGTLRLLLDMLARGVHPIVPIQGSLGASGDLAPLAHIALTMIGLGEAEYRGERLPGEEALRRARLAPVVLEAKEGLALTNGTALMAALGSLAVIEAENAAHCADVAGALSLEALHGTLWALDPRIHAARPHPRQNECAAHLRELLAGSTFVRPPDHPDVQDAYTLRCIPRSMAPVTTPSSTRAGSWISSSTAPPTTRSSFGRQTARPLLSAAETSTASRSPSPSITWGWGSRSWAISRSAA